MLNAPIPIPDYEMIEVNSGSINMDGTQIPRHQLSFQETVPAEMYYSENNKQSSKTLGFSAKNKNKHIPLRNVRA